MLVGILGINHKSAPLAMRDCLAKACAKRFHPKSLHPLYFVPLSTCNRTEIYFSGEDLPQKHHLLLELLREEVAAPFEHYTYTYFGIDAFHHLARVTSGMDSAIIGETEIQGQVRQAYEQSHCNHPLHYLFQKSLKIGKEVRTKASLSRGLPSLEGTLFSKGEELLGDLRKREILFVGVSKINIKIAQCFAQKGARQLTFCNRSDEKVQGRRLLWRELDQWHHFDLVIFGTKAPGYLISQCPKNLCRSPVVIDLSVPRNVDPKLGGKLNLINIDQLNWEIRRKRGIKRGQIQHIEQEIIERGVKRHFELFGRRLAFVG